MQNIRKPAVAGQFYPAGKKELSTMIDGYLKQATTSNITSAPRIVIAPHAGYVYSGAVAAFAFKGLRNSGYKRVVLIGRSHQQYFAGVAVDSNEAWATPLGNVPVDKDFIAQLQKHDSEIISNVFVHQEEHALEAELPFLQTVLGDGIKIIPLLFGDNKAATITGLVSALTQVIDEKTVAIVSSDLSHYPTYEQANKLDRETIEAILQLDEIKFDQISRQAEAGDWPGVATLACGQPAIDAAILLAKQMGLNAVLLKYANSGDTASETKNRVVGYAAIGFYGAGGRSEAPSQKEGASLLPELLTKEEQVIALRIARQTLEAAFAKKAYQLPNGLPEIFQEKRGVFVTFKKQGELSGCIGNFTPDISLAQNIQVMASEAAFNDPRFLPLEKSELKDMAIEISVLSDMQKITDPNLIEVGKHGVYVKKGRQSGVYLPQVASELGWNKEQFLNSLCEEKAGLNRDCWKDGTTELYIFTAQVFNEN